MNIFWSKFTNVLYKKTVTYSVACQTKDILQFMKMVNLATNNLFRVWLVLKTLFTDSVWHHYTLNIFFRLLDHSLITQTFDSTFDAHEPNPRHSLLPTVLLILWYAANVVDAIHVLGHLTSALVRPQDRLSRHYVGQVTVGSRVRVRVLSVLWFAEFFHRPIFLALIYCWFLEYFLTFGFQRHDVVPELLKFLEIFARNWKFRELECHIFQLNLSCHQSAVKKNP